MEINHPKECLAVEEVDIEVLKRTIASMDFKCQNLIDLFSFSKTATNQFLKFAVLGFNKTREMHEATIISIGMFCSIFQKRYSAFSTVFIFYLFYTT